MAVVVTGEVECQPFREQQAERERETEVRPSERVRVFGEKKTYFYSTKPSPKRCRFGFYVVCFFLTSK